VVCLEDYATIDTQGGTPCRHQFQTLAATRTCVRPRRPNENARDRGVSGASFLRNSQFPNRLLRLLATVKPTSDLHRGSTFQPCFLTCTRLAPPADLRLCLPTQLPTLVDRQILRLAFRSTSNLRWRPTFLARLPANLRLASPANLPAQPSHRPATCAACRSSSLPSDQSPACAFDQPSSSTFRLTSSLRLHSTFQFRLRT